MYKGYKGRKVSVLGDVWAFIWAKAIRCTVHICMEAWQNIQYSLILILNIDKIAGRLWWINVGLLVNFVSATALPHLDTR